MSLLLLAVVCIAVATTHSQAAEPVKTELHVLRTTTLTDEQFLTGVREGEPTTIAVSCGCRRRQPPGACRPWFSCMDPRVPTQETLAGRES